MCCCIYLLENIFFLPPIYTHTILAYSSCVCFVIFPFLFSWYIHQEHSSYYPYIDGANQKRSNPIFLPSFPSAERPLAYNIHPTKNKRENPLPNHKAYTIDKRSSSFFIIIIEGYRLYRPSLGGFNIYIPLIATCSFLYYYILLYNI